jgi:hypothetical protein
LVAGDVHDFRSPSDRNPLSASSSTDARRLALRLNDLLG